ncbi:MAG: hypothetical protein M1508_02465 [Nitrospirae bacterium]|nr:hypothetical protein [Nitrospirota bacterium]MCL5421643.1 hypothetical protein [Nitrospirota bacterium]
MPAEIANVTDKFTLILYGAEHSNDVETVAILDKEGDRYTFEPFAPKFKYAVKRGLPAKEALEEAGKFISWHNSFHQSQLRGIIDENGNVLGYELRPLYLPFTFGIDDIMDIDYRMRADKIAVIIRLKPFIQPTQL